MSADENPDRLCEPQYHRGVTVSKYIDARRAVVSTENNIFKLEKQLNLELEEKELRETEIREWMRRDKLKQAVYPIRNFIPNVDHVLYVDTDVSYALAEFKVMQIQKP